MTRDEYKALCKEAKKFRRLMTSRMAPEFEGKSDPLIRAARIALDANCRGEIVLFGYQDTLAIAALVRLGTLPANAVAIVDNGHAFAAEVGGQIFWPAQGNFDPVDVFKLGDGTEFALFLDDVPLLDTRPYDCWALKGRGVADLASHDPTKRTMSGRMPYHHFVTLKPGGPSGGRSVDERAAA